MWVIREDRRGGENERRREGKKSKKEERNVCVHPLPRLVFEERLDDGVHGVNVPRLIHKMDPSETSGKTVLRRRGEEARRGVNQDHFIQDSEVNPQTCCPE